jgi:hypothetical protein
VDDVEGGAVDGGLGGFPESPGKVMSPVGSCE